MDICSIRVYKNLLQDKLLDQTTVSHIFFPITKCLGLLATGLTDSPFSILFAMLSWIFNIQHFEFILFWCLLSIDWLGILDCELRIRYFLINAWFTFQFSGGCKDIGSSKQGMKKQPSFASETDMKCQWMHWPDGIYFISQCGAISFDHLSCVISKLKHWNAWWIQFCVLEF